MALGSWLKKDSQLNPGLDFLAKKIEEESKRKGKKGGQNGKATSEDNEESSESDVDDESL